MAAAQQAQAGAAQWLDERDATTQQLHQAQRALAEAQQAQQAEREERERAHRAEVERLHRELAAADEGQSRLEVGGMLTLFFLSYAGGLALPGFSNAGAMA